MPKISFKKCIHLFVSQIHDNEGSRNRKRLLEILNYSDYVRDQLEILLSQEQQ